MMTEEDPPFIGDWHREKKLGSGGFGIVTLWKNRTTGQAVAIKKCHVPVHKDAAIEKQIERWNREVLYMTNEISHTNIVRGLQIKPESFLFELNKQTNKNSIKMPVLVMEYCEGGDLRQQLNASINTSGLVESDVRNVLAALSSAISYLHQRKITHRDIKPENIVIKIDENGDKIYKLTDLGYAKSIDRQSLVASLVGTVEYIAPELLITDKYSCSVDYWSFGIIAFEIVTGQRPFLPHLALAQWMITVKKKSSQHISITEDNGGAIAYLSNIFKERMISEELAVSLEQWFRLALEWNPKQRGHVFEQQQKPATDPHTTSKIKSVSFADSQEPLPAPTQVLKLFTMLDEILQKKILTIFSLYSYKSLSIVITDATTMDELLAWIATNTDIPKEKIRLSISTDNASVESIDVTTRPIDLFIENYHEKPMVYACWLGRPMKQDLVIEIPDLVRQILEDHKQTLRPHILKRFAYQTFYFIQSEERKYQTCLSGLRNYALHLNHEIELHEAEINKMIKLIYGLNGAVKLFESTINRARENMETEHPEQIDHIIPKWQENCSKLSANVSQMLCACEKIVKRYKSAHRRSREVLNHKIFEPQNAVDNFKLKEFTKTFEMIRQQILSKVVSERQQIDLFKCSYNCLKRRDLLLNNEQFKEWQKTTFGVAVEIEEIIKTVEMAIGQGDKYEKEIMKINNDIQDQIWLIKSSRKSTTAAELMPDIEKMLTSLESGARITENGFHFRIGDGSCAGSSNYFSKNADSKNISCFGESDNVLTLLEDNEKLRITMDGLMKEVINDIE